MRSRFGRHGTAGLSAEAAPSPKQLWRVGDLAKAGGFFQHSLAGKAHSINLTMWVSLEGKSFFMILLETGCGLC